jgi:type II secretory pathway pseudopilin PulG
MKLPFYNLSRNKAFSLINLSITIIIIGILISGITTGVGFFKKYQLNNARNATKNGPVDKIEDLYLWLEPVMDNRFVSTTNKNDPQEGDNISTWNDYNTQVVSKMNFMQNTPSKQPKYTKEGIGGMPSLVFDGNDSLENSLSTILEGKNRYTIIVVWQQTNAVGNQVIFYQGGKYCSSNYAGISTEDGYVNGWACGNDTKAFSYGVNTPYATIYRVDGSQVKNVTLYSNGEKYGPVARDISVASGTSGVGSGGGSSYFIGLVSEVIVYNHSLNEVEINDVRGYLKNKYGFGA